MSEPRFYCPEFAAGAVELDEQEARHALLSLRLRPGEPLLLFDGRGRVGQARLMPRDDGSHTGQPPDASARRGGKSKRAAKRTQVAVEAVLNVPRPAHQLTLAVAACKGQRLDWMIEKCTELGVDRVLLATFERSVARPEPNVIDRLMRLAIAACKQCRRAWLPELEIAQSLGDALAMTVPDKTNEAPPEITPSRVGSAPIAAPAPVPNTSAHALLIADPDQGAAFFASWLHGHAPLPPRVTVVIGPEGGLTEAEREQLRAAGGQAVRLGDFVLRTETAAICVAANWAVRQHQRF